MPTNCLFFQNWDRYIGLFSFVPHIVTLFQLCDVISNCSSCLCFIFVSFYLHWFMDSFLYCSLYRHCFTIYCVSYKAITLLREQSTKLSKELKNEQLFLYFGCANIIFAHCKSTSWMLPSLHNF